MRKAVMFVLLGAAASLAVLAVWCQQSAALDWQALLSDDSQILDQRAATLRQEGPAVLEKLLAARTQLQESLAKADSGAALGRLEKQAEQLDRLIDLVGGQRYCTASRLFWYTDLEAVKKAAQESGKPILSLRMMGRLTDEFELCQQPILPHHPLCQ